MTEKRKLPDTLEHDFIICDESVNRYGWRLLVGGIDLTGFNKNPVLVMQHNTFAVSIGRWKNLRIENSELKGTAEFDRNDDDAVKLYWKYKDGYMSAVSLNVIPIEESKDKALLLPGQKYPTLTKSEMLEISLVTIPGQKNAVRLSTPEGSEYKLHLITNNKMEKNEQTVEQLKKDLDAQRRLNAENLVMRHKERGVVQEGEIESLKTLAFNDYETVSKMLDARQKQAVEHENAGETPEAKAKALVALHLGRNAILPSEVPFYENAAKLDYDGTKAQLEAKKGVRDIDTFVQEMSSNGQQKSDDERKAWGYYDYFKKDPEALQLMEKNEPDRYKKLVADFESSTKKSGLVG